MTASGLKFFTTPPHACSYLDNKQAITLFADPEAVMSNPLYNQLSSYGFRRSGNYIYKPQCLQCQACISVRIPVHHFKQNRQQKRVWHKNQDLRVHRIKAGYYQHHYDLYAHYIRSRHSDGDMYPPSVAQYLSFLFIQIILGKKNDIYNHFIICHYYIFFFKIFMVEKKYFIFLSKSINVSYDK